LPAPPAGAENVAAMVKRVRTALLSLLILWLWACGVDSEGVTQVALDPAQTRVYQTACATCHARPGIGAPLTGIDEDWRERRKKGMDGLLVSTVNGFRGMPPLGTCGLCSEKDFRALIQFMAGVP
jgi:cytochrome c5